MKDSPILFNGPMVRALLEGRKTQTRREVKPLTKRHPIVNLKDHGMTPQYGYSGKHDDPASWGYAGAEDGRDMPLASWVGNLCPYGKPGDLLWARESWAFGKHAIAAKREEDGPFVYAAEGTTQGRLDDRWRPSIHMPRWASRLTLRITDVRVQRLSVISEADAIAEGLDRIEDGAARWGVKGMVDSWHYDPRQSYAVLWEHINGRTSCTIDPWVWAISFDIIKANIDQVLQGQA